MSAIGGMVSNAVAAFSGGTPGPKLQDFLDKFTNSSGRYVDTLDPLGLFTVRFKFYPSKPSTESGGGFLDRLARMGQSLVNSGIDMLTNAADNATGGLFSALTQNGSVSDAKKNFKDVGQHSFLEYLAPANLLQGGEQWTAADQANCPLELNLSPYVQKITIPNVQMGGESKTTVSYLGDFPINGNYMQANGELQMDIVNTKASLHERIFYPWLRECTLPFWSYDTQPYTTADIVVDFSSHNDCQYVFCGCRPKQIKMMDATQSADGENLERNVIFMYDFMFVTSSLKVNDSVTDKLLGSAGALVGGAAKALNL